MPQSPVQETYQKGSIWPTIGTIVLLIIILMLGMGAYMQYMHNVQLADENSDLHSQVQTITADKEALTVRVNDLTKQLAKLECDGVWNGESCEPFPVTITTKVASGTSPLAITFNVRSKNSKYSIDYGDGTSGGISGGPNASSAGECVPKADGLCEFNIKHTYTVTSPNDTFFEVKVMKDSRTMATTSVTVTAKK